MAEGRYVPCESHRKLTTADAFAGGGLDFPCPVGAPNGLRMSRSYFRVGMSLYGAHNAGAASPPAVQEMVAFADNAVGNLFGKAEVRVNNMSLGCIEQGLPQASALRARLGNSNAWLKSLASAEMNEANFPKRVNASASTSFAGGIAPGLQSDNEMYKPIAAGQFSGATVAISAAATTTLTALTNVTQNVAGGVPLPAVAWLASPAPVVDGGGAVLAAAVSALTTIPPLVLTGAAGNALATFAAGGVVTGVNTLFSTGMPNLTTGAPTGGSVQVGDILVVRGVHYPISVAPVGASETAFTVANPPSVAIAATSNWFIIRKDVMRAPQANNTVYATWRPPSGIFDYDGILGCGNYTFHLYPNGRYLTSAVETRNPTASASIDGKTNDYSLIVNSITFFAYIEKTSIPASIQDLPMMEYQVIPKPWESTVQFSVSPQTTALTFFVQDITAGANPRVPQSMFKVLDNSDLKLASIQVSFAGTSKPATEIKSNFYNGIDQMQQYYRDTYSQSGLLQSDGAETYYDYLQRGPIYHYTFAKDENNLATEVSVTTNFTGLSDGPGSGAIGGTGKALLYCVAHFKKTIRIETSEGSVKRVSTVAS